jgi:hypothetical protein
MKKTLKRLVSRTAPRYAARLFAARARAHSQALVERWGCTALNKKLMDRFGNRVLRGPFQDLILTPMAAQEHLAPYLLGIYEAELHPIWQRISGSSFSQILDIGAKFGFYAVALGRLFPTAPVLAFDPDPWAQEATRELARANHQVVQMLDLCDPEWLEAHLEPDGFILCDCEGYEATLFGTRQIAALSSATLVIEVHEQASPGVTNLLLQRYAATHHIRKIPAHTEFEFTAQPPELASLTVEERNIARNEYRSPDQCWLFLEPRVS